MPEVSRKVLVFTRMSLWIMALALAMPDALSAQTFYGAMVGTITDSSGAIMPGATVTLTDTATNEKHEAVADVSGLYRFVNLVPANYRLEVEKSGFKRFVREPIEVSVGVDTRIDVSMQVGATTETVTVSTETPLLQTDSGALTDTVEGERVQEMPLNGRNTMNLLALTPGVVAMAPSGTSQLNQGTHTGSSVWSDYSVGGGFSGSNAMYLDGATVNLLGGNNITLIPTQDATQEFSVMSSGISAEYGRFGGGVINMTTKSGTNQWHGSVYEYFRNKVLNANNFFSNRQGVPRGKWNQDQYGVTLGNPLVKDKLFSFFSWEGFRLLYGYPNTTYVPTAAMRAGKFYKSTISDPLATQLGRTGCVTTGTDAGGNYYQIAPACIDPTAQAMLSYWPTENYPAGDNNASIGYNYVSTPVPSTGNNGNQYGERVDYNLSDKNRLFARYTYWGQADIPYGQLGNFTKNSYSSFRSTQATVGDTYTINQNTIVDVRLSYSRQYNDNKPPTFGDDLSSLGGAWPTFQNELFPKYFPSPHVNNTKEVAGGLYPFTGMSIYSQQTANIYDLVFSLSKLTGNHNLKFGGEVRLGDSNGPAGAFGGAGSFTFQEPSPTTPIAGDAWADFLFGVANSASVTKLQNYATFNWYHAYYANDIWQVSSKLTLNLGLRWELPGSEAEKHNWATVLLPTTIDPNIGILGYESLVATPAYPSRNVTNLYHSLIAPRVGLSYRITDKDVVRGSYGVTYPDATPSASSPVTGAGTSYSNNPGTGATIYAGTPYAGQYITLSNPFPATAYPNGINQPVDRSVPTWTTTLNKQSLSGNVTGQPYPVIQEWDLSAAHQFKGDLLTELRYSGLAGRNLDVALNLNELPQQYWNTAGASFSNTPYGAGFASGKYYQNVTENNAAIGVTNYNAAIVKVEKRFRSAGVVSGNYTFARGLGDVESGAMDLVSSSPSSGSYISYAAQDPEHLRQIDYSQSAFNINHRMVGSYVINLPFGKGQRYAQFDGVAGSLISGWSVNGITTLQKGFPMSIAQGQATLDTYGYKIRPSVVAGCNPVIGGTGKDRLSKWFNTSCYTPTPNFAYGTEPRVDPKVRMDGIANWDISLLKTTRVSDRMNAQFRAEFFNTFNHPQFAAPDNGVTDAAFGAVSAQYNNPRLIQFSLRINY